MKSTKNLKIIIIGLVFLLGASLFLNPFATPEKIPTKDADVKEESSGPISEMEIQLIQNMVGNYKSNQLKFVENGLKKPDAQSIWFDLETLKNFVKQIEQNTKEKDSSIPSSQLGIRMYYASYPAKEDMEAYRDLKKTPKDYEKMHTLIMVPTLKIKNTNVDYNPLDSATYSTGINLFSNATNGIQSIAKAMSANAAAQNHGTLSPPENAY
ncbi:hypothetical protein FFWV33_02945 [Flavobacterium faecale]|uniref:Uncharacterized protein n=1 Tax=Flavobacterium faecale TaxID=1355330 RepID=A0A2S1LA02_9FLAO|nr:hypothetical protein [Flavobacterium faecale]AWG20562.1 hypothetical protein FFWV33_02945 [Flavobacterium faecale]